MSLRYSNLTLAFVLYADNIRKRRAVLEALEWLSKSEPNQQRMADAKIAEVWEP